MDVDLIDIDIPNIKYDAHITMTCGDFQKYCRELANFSNFVNFEVTSNKIFKMKIIHHIRVRKQKKQGYSN